MFGFQQTNKIKKENAKVTINYTFILQKTSKLIYQIEIWYKEQRPNMQFTQIVFIDFYIFHESDIKIFLNSQLTNTLRPCLAGGNGIKWK